MSDTDRALDCAEYVLGTLTFEERRDLERDMSGDTTLRSEVTRWEDWLAGLNDVIPEIAPTATLWPAIERRLRPEPAPTSTPVSAPAPAASSSVVDIGSVRRSRDRWRTATVAFSALAAGLALFIARDRLQPMPVTYLAVVDRGGALPALIVQVDTGTETVSVRSLAAETPPGRVLELWYIGATGGPRSVGLLDRPDTRVPLPAAAQTGDLAGATLAVSVEPRGGSPTGAPTGPVVYSGKLIRDR